MTPFDRFMETLWTMHPPKTRLPAWAHMPYRHQVDILWPSLVRGQFVLDMPGRAGPYTKSNAWRKRRAVVILLGKYRCAQCYYRKAVQVHHLTYERWKEELLTDLIPVCRGCHCKIHGIPFGPDWSVSSALPNVIEEIERRIKKKELA